MSFRHSMANLAIVTGGGGALGRAFALQLARSHVGRLVLVDADEAAAAAVAAAASRSAHEAGRADFAAEACAFDVADLPSWQHWEQRWRLHDARLGLLVNAAGMGAAAEACAGDVATWRRVMDVNFWGAVWGCRTLGPWLAESADCRPRIINVASIMAALAPPAMGAYGASKAALVAFTESLAAELRPRGVDVCVALPGFFPSGLLAAGNFAEEPLLREAERLTATSRLSADEVATAALRGRGRLYVVEGRRARWLRRWKRWAPESFHRVLAARYRRWRDAER